jgi:hypothetical protein|tara:strand:+ start:1279 stop:1389 length:111 start_codon:yes stop_codon:yes gene_type:complete
MEETTQVIINIAEVKILWFIFGGIIGFVLCEIKHRQ